MNRIIFTAATVLALALAGCGKDPSQKGDAALTVESADLPEAQVPSGREEAPFIDGSKKTLTVVNPPSAPRRIEQRQQAVAVEQARREERIQQLMGNYSDNLGSPAGKARYSEQIAQELDAYKRRTLEMHRLQRASGVSVAHSTPGNAGE